MFYSDYMKKYMIQMGFTHELQIKQIEPPRANFGLGLIGLHP